MRTLTVSIIIMAVFIFGYNYGYESGKEHGRIEGARRALADLGVSNETIVSQTT